MSRTNTLRKQTRRTAKQANKKVAPVAADAREAAARYAETTRDWAVPRVEAAKDWATPRVEPALDKVKDEVLPAVAEAVMAALAATEPVRTEAAHRGSAALAALKGEVGPPRQKKHRLRKLLVLGGVLGAAYAGWKAWAAQSSSDPAQPWATPETTGSYAARTGTVSSVTAVTTRNANEDTADGPGAEPDEALAEPVPPKNAKKAAGTSKGQSGKTDS